MKTPTNWEDNQLFKDAAQNAARNRKRENEIKMAVDRHLINLCRELADDFGLTADKAAEQIRRAL